MFDITIMTIGIAVVLLAVALAKINDKVDRQIRKFRKFEDALIKNATRNIKSTENIEKPREHSLK